MQTMVSSCETSSEGTALNRMVVLDPPPDCVEPEKVAQWLEEFGRRSMFAALYYPWIQVRHPRNSDRLISVPPCCHMMGVWARIDEKRGVHKAPANEVPRGVIGLNYEVNYREQELLNPIGINCIRSFPNRGIRIWGARTLVESDNIQWRYINVRRLMSYIEKSIQLGTYWAVFEPNDHRLWASIRRSTTNFLERIWRDGALVGRTREEAFYIKCDADINTPETMALGRVYIDLKVALVRPAEFVIFRVSQLNYVGLEDAPQ